MAEIERTTAIDGTKEIKSYIDITMYQCSKCYCYCIQKSKYATHRYCAQCGREIDWSKSKGSDI